MKLLIIGASGVFGSRLHIDAVRKKWDVMGTYCSYKRADMSYLDVRDMGSMKKTFNLFRPDAVVMAGGITDVDLCALKPKIGSDVNIKGTLNLVEKIKEYDSRLIYISTDYVFDGKNGPYKEDDKPCPINKYGETKLEAENIVRTELKDFLIVRTCQLYGIAERNIELNKNFAIKIICGMKNGKKVYAAEDLYSTPTYSGLLSDMVIKLIEKNARGIYHGAGPEFLNRYDYVNKIADVFELDKALIQKVKLKDLKLKANRPVKGGLRIDKICKELKIMPKNCEYYLNALKGELI